MLQSVSSVFIVYRCKTLTGSPDPMHANCKNKPCKEYVKKLTQEDKDEVINIYNDDEVSYSLPDIKYADICFTYFSLREAYAKNSCRKKRLND